MEERTGYEATQIMSTGEGTTDAYEIQIHPGITTVISFAVAIFLILTYLFYENAILCVKNMCFRRRPPDTVSEATTDASSPEGKMANGNLRKVIREPGVLCECGQIHLLRDCVKKEELKPYKDILSRLSNRTSPETTAKCEIIDESSKKTPPTALNWTTSAKEDSDHRDPESRTTNLVDSSKSDSGGSSPRCVTPLIKLQPAAKQSSVIYAYAGARPKEYRLKEGIS